MYVIDKTLWLTWHCYSRGVYFLPYARNGWKVGGHYVVDDYGDLVQTDGVFGYFAYHENWIIAECYDAPELAGEIQNEKVIQDTQ